MAKYVGPKCRQCRREGTKLFLKGEKCYTGKCSVENRAFPPGQHGQRRGRLSDYAAQLREKQKMRRIYGVLERQFSNLFKKASASKGVTREVLLQLLESRLDNVVFRFGIAPTRDAARQLISHRHIIVNGQVVNIPSFLVKPGDLVGVREKSKSLEIIANALGSARLASSPWLEWDEDKLIGKSATQPGQAAIYPVTAHDRLAFLV